MDLPAELRQYILAVAPIFNKSQADKLGEGGQAAVYKGTYQGKYVAIKVIKPDAESMSDAADEVILTKRVVHPNIIDIIGVHLSSQGMLIVMELASDSLKGIIDKRKGPLTPFEIVTFGKQIADALNYCVTQTQAEQICHRDLKTEDVLIVNGQAKLADFGLAHTRSRTGFSSRISATKSGHGEAGTRHWQGPEISNIVCESNQDADYGENIGHRGELSDVYAFGLLLWSMATGKYPFMDKHPHQIMSLLLQGERPEIPSDVHPTLTHLIRSCWRQNYKLRPRFSNIVAILSICGAGNLGAVSKELLDQLAPIRYSPLKDMYAGELYEYLTEQGVPQSIAMKLRSRQTSGDYFTLYDARKFIEAFELSEAEARHLVSLQKPHMRPTANIGPFLNAPVTAPVNAPAATTRPFINSPILAPVFAPASILQASLPPELRDYALEETPSFQQNDADLLGKGGQGAVYKGTHLGKSVAIKVIHGSKAISDASNEVVLTKKIKHPNIIDIIGVHLSPQGMLIVMELASNSLKGGIDERKGPLTCREIVTFGKQIADALNYCVTEALAEPIHHHDLKTENVLIVNGQAKLADFGLASIRKRTGFSSYAMQTKDGGEQTSGTKHWQGPEIYNPVCKSNWDTEKEGGDNIGHRGERSDVYAFGLILWSMATGKYPFIDKYSEQIAPLLFQGERPEIPSDVHPTLTHLIRSCWRQNYKSRPKFGDVAAVLTKCGAGNLDAIGKKDLDHLVPIRYSPLKDMYYGELYEYLTEQGVPQSIALKFRRRQMTGSHFADCDARKLMDTFNLSESEARHLVSLQTLAPSMIFEESKPKPAEHQTQSASISPPSQSLPNPPRQEGLPRPNRPIPPKPIAKMDNEELIAYLRGQNAIVDSFIDGLRVDEVNGEGFLRMLDSEMLALPPYNLKGLQLRGTLKLIEELKLH